MIGVRGNSRYPILPVSACALILAALFGFRAHASRWILGTEGAAKAVV